MYRAFNALFFRSHCSNSELVTIELVKAYCLPLLLCAVESTAPAKQDIRMMDRCIDVVVRKIIRLSCSEVSAYVRSCIGLHLIAELVKRRTVKFMGSVVQNQYLSEVAQLTFSELLTFVL